MRFPTFVLILVLGSPAAARSQACPPTPAIARSPAWFEYQVEQPAHFLPAGAALPVPDVSLNQRAPYTADFALVQFIVDTSGVPIAKSLKILIRPEGLVADSVAAALIHWRYQPAKAQGCRVPQLVQSALRWR